MEAISKIGLKTAIQPLPFDLKTDQWKTIP